MKWELQGGIDLLDWFLQFHMLLHDKVIWRPELSGSILWAVVFSSRI